MISFILLSRDQLNSRPALAHIAEEGVWDLHASDEDDSEDHPFATQNPRILSVMWLVVYQHVPLAERSA